MRSIPLVAIRRRAAVALLLLTALTGGSYVLQRVDDHRREDSRTIVDVASREQMLSQRVALLVQALSGSLTPGQRDSARQRLSKSISLMAASQAALRTGSNVIPEVTAPTAARSVKAVGGPVRDFLAHARAVAQADTVTGDNPDLRYVRAAAQASLLTGLRAVGHAYLLDRTNGVLASAAIWHLDDPKAQEGFRRASEAIRLSPGVDLPGRVLVQRRPVWLADVTEDHNFPRKAVARQHGLKAAAAFPVLVQDQVVAVLEFFSLEALRPDRGLLEIMGHVGTQLGRVVERVAAEQRLLRQARHDGLTDLVNRASFHERVRLALSRPRGADDGVPAVLFIDLDNFKEVNDGLGHDAGDRLLREVAARIASVTRDADAVARLGGDEFAVLLASVRTEEEAVVVAERITQVLAAPIALRDDEALVGASIGIAIAEREGDQDLGALIRNADVAMYTAKGRSAHYHLYTPQDDNLTRSRVELVADLRRAVTTDELFLVYQPKVDLQTMQCKGVEALVRWRHPRRGILGPDAFLDLAEKSGQMRKLTRVVLDQALADQARWHAVGLPLEMAVNLSPSNLRDVKLVKDLEKMMHNNGTSAESLVLEITENVLIVDEAQAAETVAEIGRLGIALAIDDFGTGHSSLTRLRDLPLAELKIDRSFVTRMQEVRDDEKIVLSTIQLAHSLGLAVVAEGAETPDVIRRLTELGCDMGQGYAFSRPLEADALADWARVHGVGQRDAGVGSQQAA